MDPNTEYTFMEVVRNYLFIEKEGLERDLKCLQHMLKTIFPHEARFLTQIRVKTLLGKMVTGSLLTVHKEKYQLTPKEHKKIVDYRNRESKKGLMNKDELFPRLTKIRGILLKVEKEKEENKRDLRI